MNNESPKARFLKNPDRAKLWNEIVDSALWQEAVDLALLEFVTRTPVGAVYDAQAAAHRIDGARRFAAVLAGLGTQAVPSRKVTSGLDYESFDVPEGMKPASTPSSNELENL